MYSLFQEIASQTDISNSFCFSTLVTLVTYNFRHFNLSGHGKFNSENRPGGLVVCDPYLAAMVRNHSACNCQP